jgi:putative heme-binding domain-containing protein
MIKRFIKRNLAFSGIAVTLLGATYGQAKEELAKTPKYVQHNKYNLSLDDRFETTLFAAPPYVGYVTAVSADLDGTVYISVDENGSLGHVKGYGSVMTAKDTDGDGKADVYKKFIPNVSSPRGGHIVAGTYYLLHPPYLTSYTDTDGDGVSDKVKTLVTGFGGGIEHPRGADHTTNGARMGIDGWLYVSVGDFGMMDAKGTDGAVVRRHGGGVARVRPDGSELEVYVHNTRNQFDVAISPTLELFTRDNTNDGKGWNLRVHHQVAESDMGYPRLYQNFPDEHLASLADYGGGSGMGCLFLDEPGFPKDLNNKLYTCDWTSGKVFKFDMTANDATYTVEQKVFTDLVRASDIDVDGQSNLYLADWQGGKFKFAGEGVPVSRIHMAKLKGYKAPPVPQLKGASEEALIKSLTVESSATRLQAQQYLLQKGLSKKGVSALEKIALDSATHVNVRVAVLFTLKQSQGEKSHDLCKTLLGDDSMRIYAMKALTDRKSQLSNVSPELFSKHLSDTNPKVRLQAAVSLKRLNKYSAAAVADLIKMAANSWKEKSVGSLGTMALPHLASRALTGLGQSHPQAWKQYLVAFKTGDLKTQKALSYGLKNVHSPELIQSLISELGSEKWSDDNRLIILDILARLSHKDEEWDLKAWWGTRPIDNGPYYKSVDWQQTPFIISAIEKNFGKFSAASQLKVLDLLSKNQINASSLKLEGVDMLFTALEAQTPTSQYITVLKDAALDKKRPWAVRTKAGKKLFDFQEWEDATAVVFKKAKKKKGKKVPAQKIVNEEKVKAALDNRLLATKALLEALAQWQKELPQLGTNAASRDLVEASLQDYWTAPVKVKSDLKELVKIANKVSDGAATLAWKKILFAFYRPIGEKIISAQGLIDSKEALHNAGYYQAVAEMYLLDQKFIDRAKANLTWDYEGVRKSAKAVLDMHKARTAHAVKTPIMTAGVDKAAAYALKNKGDVALGKKLFDRQGCITCHAVNNSGLQKGPFMGTAGSQFTREFLIESVLNPSAAIAQGFPTYMLTPKPGRGNPSLGFLVEANNTYYTMMNIAGFYEKVTKEFLAKKEIIDGSQMPPGLVYTLNLHEFTSLIEYLSANK